MYWPENGPNWPNSTTFIFAVHLAWRTRRFFADAPVAQWLALRAYSRFTTMDIPKSRSCEERDGRGFKPLLEHLFSFFFFFSLFSFRLSLFYFPCA